MPRQREQPDGQPREDEVAFKEQSPSRDHEQHERNLGEGLK